MAARFSFGVAAIVVLLSSCGSALTPPQPEVSLHDPGELSNDRQSDLRIRVKTIVQGLKSPWGMDFLPDGQLLVTEKAGTLKLIDLETQRISNVPGVPPIVAAGQGGLMDVVVDPDFANNQLIYLSYTVMRDNTYSTAVSRARLLRGKLEQAQLLFTALPFYPDRLHFGSRLLLDRGYLYITVGDRGNRAGAQSLETHNGKVLRLFADGSVPTDNPFYDQANALPEIWSLGHRNPQGMAKNPLTGDIWLSEHGPQGGDEINLLRAGANYGWPIITYGEEYGGGKIGEGTHKDGLEQPLAHYTPSIGAAGIDFYNGDSYAPWKPSLLVAGLRQSQIARLELDGYGVGGRSRLLTDLKMRIRSVKIGPDGLIYALAGGSQLIRLQAEP